MLVDDAELVLQPGQRRSRDPQLPAPVPARERPAGAFHHRVALEGEAREPVVGVGDPEADRAVEDLRAVRGDWTDGCRLLRRRTGTSHGRFRTGRWSGRGERGRRARRRHR